MTATIQAGIDAGGTLIKIAHRDRSGALRLAKFPSNRIQDAASWLNDRFPDARLCVTGGKSEQLRKLLPGGAKTMVEFEATCSGVRFFLGQTEERLERFVLTNVGTGTSIHFVEGDRHVRIGGTGVGGGTMIGLSRLLAGIGEFDEIIRLAESGERQKLDLKVSHIYEGGEAPIPGNLTASNFGLFTYPAERIEPADYLAAVLGLVGETVSTTSVLAAKQRGMDDVVYIGSTFLNNGLLKEIVADYTKLREAKPLFVENGEFSGAVGALLSLERED